MAAYRRLQTPVLLRFRISHMDYGSIPVPKPGSSPKRGSSAMYFDVSCMGSSKRGKQKSDPIATLRLAAEAKALAHARKAAANGGACSDTGGGMTVRVAAGPMGCRMKPGPGGLGAVVTRFATVDGLPGPVELLVEKDPHRQNTRSRGEGEG